MNRTCISILATLILAILLGCGNSYVGLTRTEKYAYTVVRIDSISLKLYYVIRAKPDTSEIPIHIISFKDSDYCNDMNVIEVGGNYEFELEKLNTFVYDIRSGDSIFYTMSPDRAGMTTQNGDVLYSMDVKPFYSSQLIGLCYTTK